MNTFIHTLSHCQTATHQKASTVITNKTPTKSTVYIQTLSSGGNFGNQQKEKRKKSTKRLRLEIVRFFSFLPQLSVSLSLSNRNSISTRRFCQNYRRDRARNLSHWLYGSQTRFPSGAPNSPCSRVHPVPF